MANPINLTWTGPTTYTDGRPYGQTDHGGYEVEVNGNPGVAVPASWNVANTYTFPVADLPNLRQGDNTVRMRTVAANGQVSEPTPMATFRYLSTPKAPVNLAAV